jgi:glycosyltransferase involved in cell wall biosynthesis
MKLSILIPCYNEEKTIKLILDKVKSNINPTDEIIIIEDFSTDKTQDILKNELVNNTYKIIYNKKNYGKGYSIREGIKAATGDIILIQDADLEYNPNDYKKLIDPIKNNIADVVYGSRFIGSEQRRVLFFWHTLGNKFLTFLSNMTTNLNLTDMEVCYKAFKSEILKNIKLEENRFGFEPEITAKIARKKLRIYETGISYFGRTYEEGKKITWRDGIRAIFCIFKYSILTKKF